MIATEDRRRVRFGGRAAPARLPFGADQSGERTELAAFATPLPSLVPPCLAVDMRLSTASSRADIRRLAIFSRSDMASFGGVTSRPFFTPFLSDAKAGETEEASGRADEDAVLLLMAGRAP